MSDENPCPWAFVKPVDCYASVLDLFPIFTKFRPQKLQNSPVNPASYAAVTVGGEMTVSHQLWYTFKSKCVCCVLLFFIVIHCDDFEPI